MTEAGDRRPVVGWSLIAVGAVHVTLTPLLYAESVASMREAGVLFSVDADPAQASVRRLGFWYATAGVGMISLGWAVRELERRPEPPRALPAVLVTLGAWGVLLLPRSPFWIFAVLGGVAAVSARRGTRT